MSKPPHPLLDELTRRIHEVEHHAEEAFGHFSRRDWFLCILIGLALPALLLWVIHP